VALKYGPTPLPLFEREGTMADFAAHDKGKEILEISTEEVKEREAREKPTGEPLNVAIVGGGKACCELLKILEKDLLSKLNMRILGVADINPLAPGFCFAKELDLFVTTEFEDLYRLDGLNLLIELTGSHQVMDTIQKSKPEKVSVMDHRGSRFLWQVVQMEVEKERLEREHQEYLEKEKKHVQVILDSLPYRTMVVNMDMTVNQVNQTFLRELGLRKEQVIGKPCYQVRYNLDQPCGKTGQICYLERYLRNPEEKISFSGIREIQGEDGNRLFDVTTIAPIVNEHNEITQIVEASRDVTNRIKLERDAQKSNIFFQNVIQSTVDGIVVVDTKGHVLVFNEGMEKLTGHSAKELVHLASFYPIDVARENMRKMRSDEHGPYGKLNPTSMSIITKKGEEIPVTLSASIITIDGKEVGTVGVFTDMREFLKMRKELEEAHLQLIQVEKIASIGKMAAGVAHEINNPLAGVLLYAEILRDSLKENPQHLSDIQEIIEQTLRCKKIVSELLEFSRQSIGKASSFSLDYLITRCLNLLINQSQFQDVKVRKEIEPHMPEIRGDIGQLQQVFTNLFVNAADAMKGKGELRIRARCDKENSRFLISVSDTGPGVPVLLRDKVFDIFFTTKQVGKGTGLGLSISQNIIHLHGGKITLECPPGGGATFIVELPLEFFDQPVQTPVFLGLDEA
jgi:two-component system, NtrC family, sensor kinase